MNGQKKNSNSIEPKNNGNSVGISNIQKPSFSILNFVLLIIIIVIMITLVFVFKDKMVEYTKSYIKGVEKRR